MSLELLKSIFDWATIIFIALTVFTGAGALITGDKLGQRQEAKLHQFESDLTDAKTALGKQQERAATADAKVAGLEKDAADAKAEMSKQQERAAKAELELAQLKSPRVLTEVQQRELIGKLKAFPGTVIEIDFEFADGEAKALAMQLFAVLQKAGWKVSPVPAGFTQTLFSPANTLGIVVNTFGELKRGGVAIPHRFAPAAEALSKALKEMGLLSTYPGINKVSGNPDESVSMVVGRKPLQ